MCCCSVLQWSLTATLNLPAATITYRMSSPIYIHTYMYLYMCCCSVLQRSLTATLNLPAATSTYRMSSPIYIHICVYIYMYMCAVAVCCNGVSLQRRICLPQQVLTERVHQNIYAYMYILHIYVYMLLQCVSMESGCNAAFACCNNYLIE